ncbi:hypothetical protein HY570_01375 [Candidatus Micrarchaeota archaeon]|nr:hypothetical protein [Candidatus Micrarchaeota archaeon]
MAGLGTQTNQMTESAMRAALNDAKDEISNKKLTPDGFNAFVRERFEHYFDKGLSRVAGGKSVLGTSTVATPAASDRFYQIAYERLAKNMGIPAKFVEGKSNKELAKL